MELYAPKSEKMQSLKPSVEIIFVSTMQTERPLSDREIKILKKDLKRLNNLKSLQIKFLVGWSLLAIIVGTFVYFKLDTITEIYLLFATVVVYILIGFWSFMALFLKQKKERKNIDYVFATNKVKSIKLTATYYIELPEVEDEGVYYFFQISENEILALGGQEFYPTNNFPSDNFEIAICNGQKGELVLLETNNYGKKTHPKRKITGQQKWDLLKNQNYPAPDNFLIIDGQLDNIEAVMRGKGIKGDLTGSQAK